MEPLLVSISAELAGQRLDKALSLGSELSRSYLQQLISDGHVFLAGAAVQNTTAKVREGQCYHIRLPELTPLALVPVFMPLQIVYEDAHVLVINKPAGLTVHPAATTHEPTLVHGLLAHCGESLSGIGGVARPGIVHRLDKDTSGLMIVAKHDVAHQHLSAQLKDRSLSRTYSALCWGAPSPARGTIDAPIGRHPKDRTRMAVVTRGGREARTHYEIISLFPPPACGGRTGGGNTELLNAPTPALPRRQGRELLAFSHIKCKLESGRTHQIRVHLNHIGHGLVGDPVYGLSSEKRLKQIAAEEIKADAIKAFPRQALHAQAIRFVHPILGEEMEFECELPADMQALLDALRA